MNVKNNKRKRFDIIYTIIFILFWSLFILSAALYTTQRQDWLLVAASIAAVAWVLYTFYFAFKHWSWFIEDMINAYRQKNDLFRGGIALIMIFLTMLLFTNSFVTSNIPQAYVTLVNSLSSFFVAAMSAMIGLMGVQYTIAIQERNRKEDIRRSSKPYFAVDAYLVEFIPDENNSVRDIKIGLHIHNISRNIGIPYAVKSLNSADYCVDLDYHPLPHDGMLKECIAMHSDTPYGCTAEIILCYKDAFENKYEQHIQFELKKNPDCSNTRILGDKCVF